MTRLIGVALALIGLVAYFFTNRSEVPFTGRKQFNTISIDQAQQLGAQSYVQILQNEPGGVLCETSRCSPQEAEVVRTVRAVGERLRSAAIELEAELVDEGAEFTPVAAEFEWAFNVVPSQQPNAFALPGGYTAIYTQMLDVTGDFDGRFEPEQDLMSVDLIAVVMGHELAHALAHHGAERMSQQQLVQMGQTAVAIGVGDMSAGQQQAVLGALGVASAGGLNAFSRAHETEADKIGLDLLVRACFDPTRAPELWDRMAQLKGGAQPPEWISTHPSSGTRAENFREWMPEAVETYRQKCL